MNTKYLFLLLLIWNCCWKSTSASNQDLILKKVDQAAVLQANDPDSALVLAYEILEESREINYTEGLGYAYVRIGSIFNIKGMNDSSLFYLEKAFHIRIRLNNKEGAAAIKRLMGFIYKRTGQVDSAFTSLYTSIRLIEQGSDSVLLIQSYLELAHILSDYEQFPEAKLYYDRSLKISKLINDSVSLAFSYEGLCNYYHHIDEVRNALDNILKAAIIHGELNNKTNLAGAYNNVAVCYERLEKNDLAITFYKDALQLYNEVGLIGQTAITNYNIALLFEKSELLDSAIIFHQKALRIAEEIGDIQQQRNSYWELASVYAKKNNYHFAYENHVQFSNLSDSILNSEKISSISEMQTKYETEKKEQQIVLLDEQNKTKEAQRNLLFAAAALLLLGVFALGFLYAQRKRIAQKNELIAEQKIEGILDDQEIKTYNAMLEGQEEERMRIATDLHDRLGSMLSTVKLLFSALDDKVDKTNTDSKQQYDKANHLIDEACVEVRRVSHNLGTGMVANFGLFRALEELCESIDQSGKIKCTLQAYGIEENGLKLNMEVGIYRMVQEIVNNALKYSKAKKMSVQLNHHEDEVSIMVEDDGVGFNLEEAKRNGGMGLKNLEMRASKLDGTVHIDTKKGRGTTTIIELPISIDNG